MIIKSLDNLKLNGNVYDLFAEVVENVNVVGIYQFACTDRHSMRMDLVCHDIYGNTDNIDIICTINAVMNPLTVQMDDTIFFVNPDDLTTVRSNSSVINNIIDTIKNANAGKQQKNDANRTADTATRTKNELAKKYIPPHIVQTKNASIDYGQATIILRPNF